MGLGCADPEQIEIRGIDWATVEHRHLRLPYLEEARIEGFMDRWTRQLNATWLRPRPKILPENCRSCRICFDICPTKAVVLLPEKRFAINSQSCIDCYCCIKVCEYDAVRLEFSPVIRMLRKALGKSTCS
jgi:ferredoxin